MSLTMPPAREARVLVVGGAGYVGSVLVGKLLSAGYRVRVLDSLIWGNGAALLGSADHERFEFVRADMRDGVAVAGALNDVDAVILLAGLVGDPITKAYPEESAEINVVGVQNVIQASLSHRVSRLVFASTCSNYGLHEGGDYADESSPLSPLSLYARQKVSIEEALLDMAPDASTDLTILRFATAFGLSPRMRLDLTISHFAKDATLNSAVEIYDADTWRPYCHVADLSAAVGLVLQAEQQAVRGEVFNVGATDQNYTKRMLGELVTSLRPDVELVYREGGGDARNYRVSFEKIRDSLGFEPRHRVADHMPLLLSAMEQGVVPLDETSLRRMGNYTLPTAEAESLP